MGEFYAGNAPGPMAVIRADRLRGGDLDGRAGGGGRYRVEYGDGSTETVATRFIVMMR